jgi:hypothetical protein
MRVIKRKLVSNSSMAVGALKADRSASAKDAARVRNIFISLKSSGVSQKTLIALKLMRKRAVELDRKATALSRKGKPYAAVLSESKLAWDRFNFNLIHNLVTRPKVP